LPLNSVNNLKTKNMETSKQTSQTMQTMQKEVSFTKENDGLWYVDQPDFIELGFGTKGNLLMVAGADTLLDALLTGGAWADRPRPLALCVHAGQPAFDGDILHSVGGHCLRTLG
jgi:hypothetical protein